MGLWIGLLLFGGGACFAVGLVYLGVGLRWAQARIHLWLGLLGVLAAAMAVAEVWMYQAPSAEIYGTAFKWQLGLNFLWAAVLMVFLAEYVGGLRRTGAAMALACLAVVAVNALSFHGIVFAQVTGLRQVVLPWGEQIVIGQGPNDPLYWFLNVVVVLTSVYFFAVCVVAARLEQRSQWVLLVLVLGTVVLVGIVWAFLVDTGVVNLPYLISQPNFLLVLVMSVDLAGQVATRNQADAANRAKSDFLANMSHELRTSLSTVIGTADLLLAAGLPPRARRHVEIIDTAAEALRALIDDILDFAKLEAGRLHFEPVDFSLRELARDVGDLMTPRAVEKDLEIEIEIDPGVPDALRGNPARLRQVLLNLAGNAIKFTAEGQVAIRVEREPAAAGDARLRFSVRDTGVGLSPTDQRRVFETFFQAAAARRLGGSGLGLTISKELIEQMGGKMVVESERGVGSTFIFHLPLVPARGDAPETLARKTSRRATVDRGRFRVLLVDDHTTNRNLARAHLELLGYRIAEAASGEAALEQLAEAWVGGKPSSAVLMDCQMPGLDGYETTRRLRRQEAEHGAVRTPVIALTAQARAEEREKCLAAGMDDFLAKPYRGSELAAILDRWLVGPVDSPDGGSPDEDSSDGDSPGDAAEVEPSEDQEACLAERIDALRQLSEHTGRDILGEAIADYLHNGPALFAAMRQAHEREDTVALAAATHSLAGHSAMLGAVHLGTVLQEIEARALNGELDDFDSRLREVEKEQASLVAHLVAMLRQEGARAEARP